MKSRALQRKPHLKYSGISQAVRVRGVGQGEGVLVHWGEQAWRQPQESSSVEYAGSPCLGGCLVQSKVFSNMATMTLFYVFAQSKLLRKCQVNC